MSVTNVLFSMQDPDYQAFQRRLIPNISPASIIGVRVPQLRRLAKELTQAADGGSAFLESLPHVYYEENLLHAILLSNCKEYSTCIKGLDRFLPHVDNWAVCDTLNPRIFKKHRDDLIHRIEFWLAEPDRVYICRFGIKMLMTHFLEDDFDPVYLTKVASIPAEDYYLKMMKAWYFATALAKQWEETLPYITEQRTKAWVHRKIIQKACESFRLTDEQKNYLRQFR